MTDPGAANSSSKRRQLARSIAADYLAQLRAGALPNAEALIEAHPDLSSELREELQAVALIARGRVIVDGNDDTAAIAVCEGRSSETLSLGDSLLFSENRFGRIGARDITGYEVLDEIHRGGQGVVFRAVQLSTRREVAVKVLLEGAHPDERARARFEREVHLVAQLKHPNIVVVHESGITQGNHYFAMDLVDGAPIDKHVQRKQPNVRDLIQMFMQICDAMGYSHRRGVIHRDLKPGNVLVDTTGKPVVVDFGMAKTMDVAATSQHTALTETGHLLGTILYMSPEQTRGDHDAIDSRTDVYSLGLILYQLMTGSFPYDRNGDITQLIRAIREFDPPRPSRVRELSNSRINGELDAIVLKAMAKEPERRYASASEMQADLEAWLNGNPVQARGATTLYLIRTLVRRHRFVSAVVALLGVIVLSSIALIVHFYVDARTQNEALKRSQAFNRVQNAGLEFDAVREAAQLRLAEQSMGYFLFHLSAGDQARAREIAQLQVQSSPYAAAMFFLLGDLSAEELAVGPAKNSPGLIPFAHGIQSVAQGDSDVARKFFLRAVSEAPDWLRDEARAQLSLLGDHGTGRDTLKNLCGEDKE